jgi:hypothetical protein
MTKADKDAEKYRIRKTRWTSGSHPLFTGEINDDGDL